MGTLYHLSIKQNGFCYNFIVTFRTADREFRTADREFRTADREILLIIQIYLDEV